MKVSVIIPTINEANYIGRILEHLHSHLTGEYEILVVDGGSTDETIAVCKHYNARVISSKPSRAIQQNVGAAEAKYPYVYFVHADTLPPTTVDADLKECMSKDFTAACYRSTYDTKLFILKINAFFTRFNWLVCRGGDQSLLIKKETFFKLGGFDENMVIMEEYPLIEKLMDAKSLKIIPKAISISARKYEERSWLQVSRANYKAFKLFKQGEKSEEIRKVYREALKK